MAGEEQTADMARGSSSGGFKVVVAVVFCFSIYSLLHSHLHHDRVHKDFKALAALEARLQSGRFGLGVDSDILPGQQGEESMHRQDGGNEETGRVHQQERPGAEEEAGQDAADGRAGEGGQLETWEDGANKGKAGDGGRPRGDDGPITRESQVWASSRGPLLLLINRMPMNPLPLFSPHVNEIRQPLFLRS